jgi:hypothetical protein
MIKAVCIIFSLLVFKVACGQDYLVTVGNDTLQGELKLLNFGLEPKVQLSEPGEKKKTTYTILQIKGFQLGDEIYHTVRTETTYKFMRLIVDGYLRLYAFESDSQPQWSGRYLATLDARTMEVPNLGFKKRLSAFTQDCQGVSKDIEDGKFSKLDIEEIVNTYNSCIEQRSERNLAEPSTPDLLTQQWDSLEESVAAHAEFDGKKDVMEMIKDIKLKLKRSENIPNFLLEGLRSNLKDQSDLLKLLETVLEQKE